MKKKYGSKVHKDIKGFDIHINQFGELKSNMKVDELNQFLDRHVSDKKILDQSVEPTHKNEEE